MVVVLIGKLKLECVGKDIVLVTPRAFKQIPVASKNQRLRRHCGWGELREGDIGGSDLKLS